MVDALKKALERFKSPSYAPANGGHIERIQDALKLAMMADASNDGVDRMERA